MSARDPRAGSVRRRVISAFQSGMADLDDAVDGGGEALPALALLGEDAPAGGGDAVVAAPALAGLLDPPSLEPAALFQLVEERIEGGDLETDGAVGLALGHLADLVAVARPLLEQGEDDQLGAALLQLAVEDPGVHVLHQHILHSEILQ